MATALQYTRTNYALVIGTAKRLPEKLRQFCGQNRGVKGLLDEAVATALKDLAGLTFGAVTAAQRQSTRASVCPYTHVEKVKRVERLGPQALGRVPMSEVKCARRQTLRASNLPD